MQKRLTPTLDVTKRYELKYSAPIFAVRSNPNEPLLKSTGFTHNGYTAYIEDRVLATGEVNPHLDKGATHVLQMYRVVDNAKLITNTDVGYIIADQGIVVLTGLMINSVPLNDGNILFSTIPASDDIAPKREQLLEIDMSLVSITPSIDTIATGGSQAGIGYSTTNRLL